MSLDLDRFKVINDTLGHPVGDELLRGVGGTPAGPFARGRHRGAPGGDEFVVLLPRMHTERDAAQVAARSWHLRMTVCGGFLRGGEKTYCARDLGDWSFCFTHHADCLA